ncbi:Scs3p NDAI_0I01750 [Naumovozyma dairenensis CBS 421]|uniref:Acyl-coenzyme A diphosphatase SCS3 n=1 Tax=Naumovozyma dairenensis (strain ATCC 10597 / BCRC 20456 / CBS 421 / NBRC 0211 / NRRL Y-12639) TaxID=1071378 RepID=G0WG33_NAUDC|nr:hypothetical protein NDAI_0I01750 [Naumovozyma dairenensis CBS 421]CCD26744.1 hypothetical protein NDAI_0I01750 [Naumovozyma dairenensis CBS 421]
MCSKASLFKLLILTICPLTLLIGYIISQYLTRSGIIMVNTVDKDGLINTLFVKKGWFWTTLVGWFCIYRYNNRRPDFQKILWKAFKHYCVLTCWWYAFTQSIFIYPPLMDLIFLMTGGLCNFDVFNIASDGKIELNLEFQDNSTRRMKSLNKIYKILKRTQRDATGDDEKELLLHSLNSIGCALEKSCDKINSTISSISSNRKLNEFINTQMNSIRRINTSAQCRMHGGYWTKGHDPSGHIFLLTLMVMFLSGELSTFAPRAFKVLFQRKKIFHLVEYVTKLFDNGLLWDVAKMRDEERKNWKVILHRAVVLQPIICLRDLSRLLFATVKFIIWDNPVIVLIALIMTWLWSFVITILAFHTVWEQLSGFLFAYLVALAVYL